jgi:TolA-binding protein
MIGFVALAIVIGVLANQAFVSAQESVTVERRDKKGAVTSVPGTIVEENAGGVRIKSKGLGKEETIPSSDIVRVSYPDMPLKARLDLDKLAPAEASRDLPALLKGYEAVQAMPEIKAAGAGTRRYIDFRVAMLRAAVAEGDEQIKEAVKGLSDFMTAHPNSWQYSQAARQLARLQADTGDYAGATKMYETLEKMPNAPPEYKLEATAALIDIAFQTDNESAAQQRIAAVAKDPKAPTSLKARVDMYQLGIDGAKGDLSAAVKKVEDAIFKTSDPSLKALGYNVLGDLYLKKGQTRDAMWSYLWVDVVYNQDRGEHLKAMTRLIKVFEKENDKDKATLYKEKLARSR